jgi:chemotaxis protein CheD
VYIKNRDKLGKNINIIHPGEYYITAEDELIGTLLGSCVSVCLHDSENHVGGMNHFMLPGRIRSGGFLSDDYAKYGITAINKIINGMLEKGAKKENLTAKVFGGGSILNLSGSDGRRSMIPADNIRIARILLEIEDIPIISTDVGSNYTRKIIFDAYTGKVYLRKIMKSDVSKMVVERDIKILKIRENADGTTG